jgi:hypothetical protein
LWQRYKDGIEIGTIGPEEGEIVKDEVHACDARIILEKNCRLSKYAVTFEINGFFIHATFFYITQML